MGSSGEMLRGKDSLFLILSDTHNNLKMVHILLVGGEALGLELGCILVFIFLPDLLGDFDNTFVISV